MPPPPPQIPIQPRIPSSLSEYNKPLTAHLEGSKYSQMVTGAVIFRRSTTGAPEILMVQRAANDSGANAWEIPGGAVDFEDETVLAGCVREVWEETGLRVKEFVSVVHPGPDGTDTIYDWYHSRTEQWVVKTCFLVEVETKDDGGVDIVLDPAEHQNWKWCAKNDVKDLELFFENTTHIVDKAFRLKE